ncbi:MAG: TolC family protein [Deltaproteobacteria bacterium]|nr:TolC family protein [Deltaproteobacteria bacterium]
MAQLLLVFSLIITSATGIPRVETKKVSLKKFISIVLEKNPSMEQARLQIQRYKAMLSGANMLWLPSVSSSLQGAPTPKYTCVVPPEWLAAADLGNMSEKEFRETYCVGTNREDTITTDLDGYVLRFEAKATIPLYTFGKIKYAREMAKSSVSLGRNNLKMVRQQTALLAKKAWYAARASRDLSALMIDSQKLMDKSREKAEKMEDDGKITSTDLIRLKLGQNELKMRALEIRKLDNISKNSMRILAGINVEPDDSELKELPLKHPAALSLLVDKAFKYRPEFKILKAARATALAKVGLAKAAFMPNIGVFLRYRYTLSNSDDPKSAYLNDPLHGNSLAFGLAVEVKIDPSSMITAVRLAKIDAARTEVKLAQAKSYLRFQISAVRENIVYEIDRIKLINRGIKLSRGWLLALEDQESLGVLKPKELVDALVAWFKLKFSLIEASWKLRLELLKLESFIGTGV